MTTEATPGRRRQRTETPPPKDSDIPKDVLLTRGFVKRLPGYVEGQRIEHGRFSGNPNWSGEAEIDGMPAILEIIEHSDNALEIIVTTQGRRDVYRSEIRHSSLADRSYISYQLRSAKIIVFPLVPESNIWRSEFFERQEQNLYFLDNEYHHGKDSNEQIFREGEVGTTPPGLIKTDKVYSLSERMGKDKPIYKSFEVLKELMLKAKPTTPPASDW